jgi:hypothetical protein
MAAVSAFGIAFFKKQSRYLYKCTCSDHLLDEKPFEFNEEMVTVFNGKEEDQFKPHNILSSALPTLRTTE